MRRRTILIGGAVAAFGPQLKALQAADEAPIEIIDCHTHFYDPSRPEGVPWPAPGSPLYRTVLPRDLRAQKQYRPLTGTVVVEASPRLEDNAWLLELAANDPFLVGIVGHLKPEEPEFAQHVKRFAANKRFRGIRISVGVLKSLLDQDRWSVLRTLAEHDLSLDVNGGPDSPATVARAAAKLPELRFVINHVGNVRITGDAPPTDWAAGIRAAGERPNVFCKISALVEGAAPRGAAAKEVKAKEASVPTDLSFYVPYVDVVWKAFGDDRVIYGSNWPVSDRAADYFTVQRLAFEYAASRGSEALRRFAAENARRAYKWFDPSGRRGERHLDRFDRFR